MRPVGSTAGHTLHPGVLPLEDAAFQSARAQLGVTADWLAKNNCIVWLGAGDPDNAINVAATGDAIVGTANSQFGTTIRADNVTLDNSISTGLTIEARNGDIDGTGTIVSDSFVNLDATRNTLFTLLEEKRDDDIALNAVADMQTRSRLSLIPSACTLPA